MAFSCLAQTAARPNANGMRMAHAGSVGSNWCSAGGSGLLHAEWSNTSSTIGRLARSWSSSNTPTLFSCSVSTVLQPRHTQRASHALLAVATGAHMGTQYLSGRRRCRSKPEPSHLAAQAAAAACGPHGRECASADALLKAVPPPCGSARDGQLRCGACGDRCPGPQCQRTHRPMMACTTLLPSSRSTHIVRTTPVCAAIAHAAAAAYRSAYRRGAT